MAARRWQSLPSSRLLLLVATRSHYFTIVSELTAELAHIEAIVATKAKLAQFASHVALASLVGVANFLSRVVWKYSGVEEDGSE